MLIIEIKKSKRVNEYFFRIKGTNGKILAASETYRQKSYCIRIVKKISNTVEWKIRGLK